jgi:hypothetical protein
VVLLGFDVGSDGKSAYNEGIGVSTQPMMSALPTLSSLGVLSFMDDTSFWGRERAFVWAGAEVVGQVLCMAGTMLLHSHQRTIARLVIPNLGSCAHVKTFFS